MIQRLSPDGQWIASGTEEGMIRVQSVVSGTERWSVSEAHQGVVHVLAWSPDGRALASGGNDAVVNVWEATTGSLLAHAPAHAAPISILAWSPDGSWLACAAQTGSPYIWSIADDTVHPTQ